MNAVVLQARPAPSVICAYPGKRGGAVDELDPVTVRVERKRKSTHITIGRLLLHHHTRQLHRIARLLEVVDEKSDVPKSLRLSIAVVHLELGVALRAVVPREL